MTKTDQENKLIAIVGGGASGLVAAIQAAWSLQSIEDTSTKITIYEANDALGKSILQTGNGRCNFSNSKITTEKGAKYNHPGFVTETLLSVQNIFGVNAVEEMFSKLGLLSREEKDGRLYPVSNKATSVRDVLLYAVEELGIHVECNTKISKITQHSNPSEKKYLLITDSENKVYADKVIVSTGKALHNIDCKNLDKDSVTFVSSQKILGPVKTDTQNICSMNGIRINAYVKLKQNEKLLFAEPGEVLFRKYGISGIVVFNLSRHVAEAKKKANTQKNLSEKTLIAELDLMPNKTQEDLVNNLKERFNNNTKTLKTNSKNTTKAKEISAERLLAGILLPEVANSVAKLAGCKGVAVKRTNKRPRNKKHKITTTKKVTYFIKEQDLQKIAETIKCFKLKVYGIEESQNCQVVRGGISISSVSKENLEVLSCPGLYCVGEALDVDGPCGGYNLHWAWASGLLAGHHAAITTT